MGSKKRIFFIKPQKKIKQKHKTNENIKHTHKNIKTKQTEFKTKQIEFLQKELICKRLPSIKILYDFYSLFIRNARRVKKQKNKLLKKIFNLKKTTNILAKKVLIKLSKNKIKNNNFLNNKRISELLTYYYFKLITLNSIGYEIKTMFLLGANIQQYFLNTLGINYPFFRTMSSGRCLKRDFGEKIAKSLKKSFKLNKALISYYFNESLVSDNFTPFTHTMLKPFNKKTLIFFNQLQANSEYYHTFLGFHKYYKINFKSVKRIKKKIKKTITSENLTYKPYRFVN